MRLKFLCSVALFLLAGAVAPAQTSPAGAQHPKIRAVTAFIRLERQNYGKQVAEALVFLRAAKAEFEKAGYEVETLRITTQPFPEYTRGLSPAQALDFFKQYDQLAQKEGFTPDIGGAVMRDGDDPAQAELLARIIAETQTINGFVAIAGDDGIHWNGIRSAAKAIKYLEEHTPHSEGNFRFAAGAFPPVVAPFFPVSHTSGVGHSFAIGVESAGIVQQAFSATPRPGFEDATSKLSLALQREAVAIEAIARRVGANAGWQYQGIDLTPVPLKDISIGAAMESLIGAPIGSPGSLSTAFTITSAVKRVAVKQVGYSGLMLPVMEDSVLARRWEEGTISRDSLMSYSSVCSTGLDAVPLPGDISEADLAGIMGDVASLAVKWHKPLSARLLPVAGKRKGDMTEFSSPYLVNIHIR